MLDTFGHIGDTPNEYLIANAILRDGGERVTFAAPMMESAMKQSSLDLGLVRRVLAYDSETGIFTWANPVSARVSAGQRAGVIASNGRRYIGILGEKVIANRLAWFYHYGVWPDGNVRQKNGDYDDVRIDNLVEETAADTARRATLRHSNTSGMKGVSWSEQKRKWVATITRDYRRVHLGYFDDQQAASDAYVAAIAEIPTDRGTMVAGADAIADRRHLRALWNRVLRQHKENGWSSFAIFIVDVGAPPSATHDLAPQNADRPVGPGNYRWVEREARSTEVRAKSGYWQERDLLRKFGLTPADIDRMVDEQEHACAICRQPETAKRRGVLIALAIDHDHAKPEGREAVRGLLCRDCNQAIGKMNDDPARLRAAAAYLESHAASTNIVPLKKDIA